MKLKKLLSCFLASAIAAGGLVTGNYSFARIDSVTAASYISAPATSDVLRETAYITWTPVADADGYNVYVKPAGGAYTKLDTMLTRQYSGYFSRTESRKICHEGCSDIRRKGTFRQSV